MMDTAAQSMVHLLSLLSVLLVFGFATVGKLRNPDDLADVLATLRIGSPGLMRILARAVVAGEITVLGLLLFEATRTAGFALAAVSLVGYSVAVALMVSRGVGNCACFGQGFEQPSYLHAVRNLLLIGVCGAGLATADGRPQDLGAGLLALTTVGGAWIGAVLVKFPVVFRTLAKPFRLPG